MGGPATLGSVGREGVGSGTVNKAPVAESEASAIVEPGGTCGELVVVDGSSHFTLIRFSFEVVAVEGLDMVVEEGGGGFMSD